MSNHRTPRAHRARGIYLVSTLLLLTTLVIVSGAVMVSFGQSLRTSGSVANRQLALQAAMCGLTWIQARLESNATTYSPLSVPDNAPPMTTASGDLQVAEIQNGLRGYVTSGPLNGGEASFRLLFRAAFNNDYSLFKPPSILGGTLDEATFDGQAYTLPPLRYLSVNNLNRLSHQSTHLYTAAGTPMRSLPGGMADVVVEGLVLSSSGTVLATRVVESVLNLGQIGSISSSASAAKDITLSVLQRGGGVTLTSQSTLVGNLASYGGDIRLQGLDAASGSTPPGYTSTTKAMLGSGSNRFIYQQDNGGATDFTSSLSQVKPVLPPAIAPSKLPQLKGDAAQVDAGLWVIWNEKLYHYPTTYQAMEEPKKPRALSKQPWTQPDRAAPPLYDGVATDTPSGRATLDAQGTLALNPQTNSITVSRDLQVKSLGSLSSFALVVAPTATTDSRGRTLTSLSNTSAAVGSAQMSFEAPGGVSPQLRSEGEVAVIGNVVGQGSLVAGGEATSITVVGRSALDPRSDVGVAMYATGDLNFLQLSHAQPPALVPAVGQAFADKAIHGGAGSGASVAEAPTLQVAQAAAISQAIINSNPPPTLGPSNPPGITCVNGQYQLSYTGIPGVNGAGCTAGDHLKDVGGISVNFNGQTYSGSLLDVLTALNGGAQPGYHELGNLLFTSGAFPANSTSWTTSTTSVSTSVVQNYTSYVTPDGSGPVLVDASSSGSTSAALSQSFRGLIYAGRNVNFTNKLGNLSIHGAVSAFGGDPRQAQTMGTDGGELNLAANNITITYDPEVVGMYSSFFGGQVTLTRSSTSNF